MAKTSKRTKLATKASSKTAAATSAIPSTAPKPIVPTQQTKDSKREAKHDAFLKSKNLFRNRNIPFSKVLSLTFRNQLQDLYETQTSKEKETDS
jgi:hypothetical protein